MAKPQLPGSRFIESSLRRRFMRKIRAKAEVKLNGFMQLSSLESDAKQRLRRNVCHLEIQVAALEVWRSSLRFTLMPLILLPGYGAIVLGPFLLGRSWPLFRDKFLHEWVDVLPYTFVAFLLAVVILTLPSFLIFINSKKALEYFGFSTLLSIWMTGGIIVYAAVAYRTIIEHSQNTPGTYEQAIVIAFVSVIGYVTVVLALTNLITLLNRALRIRQKRLWPNAVVADLFLEVLSKTEKHERDWKDVEFKRTVIQQLEEIADCIERDLPSRLRTGHAGTDFWQRQTAEQISAGVRNLIRWVYTPKEDTRQQFIKRVANYLVLAVRDDWDGFERAEPQVISRPELLRSRLKTAVTAVLSAMVPLLLLALVKQMNFIEGPVLTYLTVGAFVWAGLSLVSHVDPSYGSKLTAIKDITGLLPLPKKSKE